MTNVEKLKAYYGNRFDDKQIDEAVPRDLVRQFKRTVGSGRGQSYHSGSYISDLFPNTDLANSSVRELTPQEADEEIKKGNFKNLIYIIDKNSLSGPNQFVTLRQKEDGTIVGSNHFSADVNVDGKEKNTRKIRAKGLGKLADHIYFYDNVDKDPELIKLRGKNPESPNWTGYSDFDDPSGRGMDAFRTGNHSTTLKSKDDFAPGRWDNSVKYIKDNIEDLEKRINRYKANGNEVPERWYSSLDLYKKSLSDYYNKRRDRLARLRNAESEKSVNGNVRKYKDLKGELGHAQWEVNRAKTDLADVQNRGSSTTRITRDRITSYKERLNSILAEIARLEMQLDDAMEKDSENIGSYQQAVDNAVNKLNDIQNQIDSLLRR